MKRHETRLTNKRLLFVDDDQLALDSTSQLLDDVFQVDIARTPEEALELIRKNNYDAILMDIGLGLGKNGIELTKEIKLIPEYENTPIIAVTAYASRRDEEYILNHGLDFYIAKPFYKKDILKILEKALNIELSDLSKQD